MAPKGTVAVKFIGDTRNLERDMDGLSGKFRSFGGLAKAGMGAAVAGIGGLAVALGGAVKEAQEAAKIGRLTEAVIKSTGGAANVTADQVASYAEKLSNLAGVDDEAIQGGQNLLLTFTKVRNEVGAGNDIFDQATKAALNMSVALGTDMNSAAMLMGKALNDPIKGMTALTRSGVSFTQQQKDMVKAMVEAGDTLGAQKIILGEMTTQFGGAAEAAADPMTKLGVIVGNLQEKVGTALLPVIEKVATWLGENLPVALETASRWFGTVRSTVESVVGAISGFLERFRSDQDGASAKVQEASERIGEILEVLRETFDSAFSAIKVIVETVIKVATEAWERFGKGLVDNVQRYAAAVVDVVKGLATAMSGVFDLIKAVLTGKWGDAWDAIKKILGGAWDAMVGLIKMQIEVIRSVVETVMGTISGVWSTAWNGLKTAVGDVWDGIKSIVGDAVRWVLDKVDSMLGPIDEVIGRLRGLTQTDVPDWVREAGNEKGGAPQSLLLRGSRKDLQERIKFAEERWADLKQQADLATGTDRHSTLVRRAREQGQHLSGLRHQLRDLSGAGSALGSLGRGGGGLSLGGGGGVTVNIVVPNFFGDKRELLALVKQVLVDDARSNGNALGGLA